MSAPATRSAPWRTPMAGLLAASLALGVALLGPRVFSDPVGVDPYQVRLAGVSLALVAAAAVGARMTAGRPVLLAVAAVATPFCLWSATPDVIVHLTGDRVGFNTRVLVADVVYAVSTLAFVAAVRASSPRGAAPAVRLRGFSAVAAGAAVAGSALLIGIAMALPAPLLGREGIEPIVLARDMPLLAPAYALQAAAQEVQFRGLLLGVLESGMPAWAANLGQAAFFGLAHLAVQYEGPAGPFVPLTVSLGLVLGWLTQRTGSLWPAITIHAVLEVGVAVTVLTGLYGF